MHARFLLFAFLVLLGLGMDAKAQDAIPLPIDQAFKMTAASGRDGGVVVRIDMPVGYYLYRNKLQFGSKGFQIEGISLPAGQTEDDPFLGQVTILSQSVTVKIKTNATDSQDVLRYLMVKFQGCAKDLICYPPSTRMLAIQP